MMRVQTSNKSSHLMSSSSSNSTFGDAVKMGSASSSCAMDDWPRRTEDTEERRSEKGVEGGRYGEMHTPGRGGQRTRRCASGTSGGRAPAHTCAFEMKVGLGWRTWGARARWVKVQEAWVGGHGVRHTVRLIPASAARAAYLPRGTKGDELRRASPHGQEECGEGMPRDQGWCGGYCHVATGGEGARRTPQWHHSRAPSGTGRVCAPTSSHPSDRACALSWRARGPTDRQQGRAWHVSPMGGVEVCLEWKKARALFGSSGLAGTSRYFPVSTPPARVL